MQSDKQILNLQDQSRNLSATTEWTNESNLQAGQKYKKQANEYFVMKQYKNALKYYHKSILHINGIIQKGNPMAMYTKTASQEISKKANTLKYSIWLNMVQIYIFEEKYEKGLDTLKKAENLLQKIQEQEIHIKTSPKLRYRKGVCFMKLNYFEQARRQFRQLKQIDNSFNKQIQQFEQEIKQRQKKQNEKAKKVFQGFFK